MKNFIVGILFTLFVLAVAVAYYVMRGYLDTRADQPPSAIESKIAMSAMDASADRHAPDQKNPVPATEENLVAGAKLYLDSCAGCHGLPSNPDSQFGRSFYPPVPAFFKDVPDMTESQNFYTIRHGVRWTGMPAWNKTLSDQQIWELVTFLSNIEKLPPAASKVLGPSEQVAPGR
jgi:mono/diheme cytochrome c family protein